MKRLSAHHPQETLDKLRYLSIPQFPHLPNGDNKRTWVVVRIIQENEPTRMGIWKISAGEDVEKEEPSY